LLGLDYPPVSPKLDIPRIQWDPHERLIERRQEMRRTALEQMALRKASVLQRMEDYFSRAAECYRTLKGINLSRPGAARELIALASKIEADKISLPPGSTPSTGAGLFKGGFTLGSVISARDLLGLSTREKEPDPIPFLWQWNSKDSLGWTSPQSDADPQPAGRKGRKKKPGLDLVALRVEMREQEREQEEQARHKTISERNARLEEIAFGVRELLELHKSFHDAT
jgi:hypothetical protein